VPLWYLLGAMAVTSPLWVHPASRVVKGFLDVNFMSLSFLSRRWMLAPDAPAALGAALNGEGVPRKAGNRRLDGPLRSLVPLKIG
jgi:hypothetical protein